MAMYQVVEVRDVLEIKNHPNSSQWAIIDLNRTDTFVEVSDDAKDLCKRLKDLKFIDTCDLRKVSVSSLDKDLIEIRNKKSLKPLCRLEIARWIIQ